MSNSSEKPESVIVKDKRRGVIEQTPVHGKKHIKRPYKIVGIIAENEMTLGHYADKADAEKALHSFQHKGYVSVYIVAPGDE